MNFFSPHTLSLVVSISTAFFMLGCGQSKQAPQDPLPAHATESQGPLHTAQIELVDPQFNFGTVREGETISHVFKIRNTGKAPLKIIRAKAS